MNGDFVCSLCMGIPVVLLSVAAMAAVSWMWEQLEARRIRTRIVGRATYQAPEEPSDETGPPG